MELVWASIHEGWEPLSKEQTEAFLNAASAADEKFVITRDLNHLPLGKARLADYVIKVSDDTPELN